MSTLNSNNYLFDIQKGYGWTSEYYTKEYLLSNLDKIYVFGDNFKQRGTGGQAIIRHCPNVFGIPTKRAPTYNPLDYIYDKDSDIEEVRLLILESFHLLDMKAESHHVVFPAAGLGTGIARLEQNAPELLRMIDDQVSLRIKIDYRKLRAK